jgi:hypothetical protein
MLDSHGICTSYISISKPFKNFKKEGNISSVKVLTFEYHVDISNIHVVLYW